MPSELVTRVRAKYPNEYKDLSDAALEAAILKKYPEYQDLAAPTPPPLVSQLARPRSEGGFTVSDFEPSKEPVGDKVTDAPMFQGAAHPEGFGDILNLLIPSEAASYLGARKAAQVASEGAITATDVAKGIWQGAKAYLAKRAPVISDIVKATKNEAVQRELEAVLSRVDDPDNVSKALQAIAKKQGGKLAPKDAKSVFDIKAIVDEARGLGKDAPLDAVKAVEKPAQKLLTTHAKSIGEVHGPEYWSTDQPFGGPYLAKSVKTLTLKDVLGLPKTQDREALVQELLNTESFRKLSK